MATHSSVFAYSVPWTEDPGRLQSMGSQRVRQDLATKEQQTKRGYIRGVLRINYCPSCCCITKNVSCTPSSRTGGSLFNAYAASLHLSASISSLFQVCLAQKKAVLVTTALFHFVSSSHYGMFISALYK